MLPREGGPRDPAEFSVGQQSRQAQTKATAWVWCTVSMGSKTLRASIGDCIRVNSVLKSFDITGRSALVTGAASGLGLAYAETMAEAGAAVTLLSLSLAEVERQAARLRGLGGTVRAVAADVSDPEQVRAAVDAHVREYGGLDIAFANAGVGIGHGFMRPMGGRDPEGQIDTCALEDWQRTLDVNLSGAMFTIRMPCAR
jgi:NAD(P)-dependent dehydrogenase (short-subunit alcohol dehydrogenase family)